MHIPEVGGVQISIALTQYLNLAGHTDKKLSESFILVGAMS